MAKFKMANYQVTSACLASYIGFCGGLNVGAIAATNKTPNYIHYTAMGAGNYPCGYCVTFTSMGVYVVSECCGGVWLYVAGVANLCPSATFKQMAAAPHLTQSMLANFAYYNLMPASQAKAQAYIYKYV